MHEPFEALRHRWKLLLVGDDAQLNVPALVEPLQQSREYVEQLLDGLCPQAPLLWDDLTGGGLPAARTAYERLRDIALVHASPGSSLQGDPGLADVVVSGLDRLNDAAYNESRPLPGDWYDEQIGLPHALLDTCVLIRSHLSDAQLKRQLAAVHRFVPVELVASYTGTSTGSNRSNLCQVLALSGLLGHDPKLLSAARDGLSPVFRLVLAGDGLYADGSLIQHTWVPYTGSYGAGLLRSVGRLLQLLAGSPWAVTDPQHQNFLRSVSHSFAPFIYNGLMMDGVSGRAIERRAVHGRTGPTIADDHTRGHEVIAAVLALADSGVASLAEASSWCATVKGWILREQHAPYLSEPVLSIADLARAHALLADPTTVPAPEPSGHRLFAQMDRAVHRRPGWAASISMSSARTTYYETGNGENVRGWHTGSGMTYWWGKDFGNDQYSDGFWSTVDPYRLPGTTVSRKPLADEEGGLWGASRPAMLWAGGATDGHYAAVGQDVRGLSSYLEGKKSWFCLDEMIVCLGAGIYSSDGFTVETTVDNRNLGSTDTQALVIDGIVCDAEPGEVRTYRDVRYATVEGSCSYVFPDGADLCVLRESRTADGLTRQYLTLWLDHGVDPHGARYAYYLVPGADRETAADLAERTPITVLANTPAAQAIHDPALGLTAANFFGDGTAGSISADTPCSVLLRDVDGTPHLTAADPTRAAETVTLSVRLDSTQSVTFRVGNTHGASQTSTLTVETAFGEC